MEPDLRTPIRASDTRKVASKAGQMSATDYAQQRNEDSSCIQRGVHRCRKGQRNHCFTWRRLFTGFVSDSELKRDQTGIRPALQLGDARPCSQFSRAVI